MSGGSGIDATSTSFASSRVALTLVQTFRWLLLLLLVVSLCHVVVAVPRYHHWCSARISSARQFIDHNCGSIDEMQRLGTMVECARRAEIRNERSVNRCTLDMMLVDFRLCGAEGCTATWRATVVQLILFFVTVVLAIVFAVWLLGRFAGSLRHSQLVASMLPTHQHAPCTYKQE